MRLLKKLTQEQNKTNEKRHLALSNFVKIFSMYKRTISKIFACFPSNIPLLLRFQREVKHRMPKFGLDEKIVEEIV